MQLLTTLSEKNEEVKLLTSESAEKDRKIAALEEECDIRRRQTIKYCAKAMYADAAIGKGENLTIRETARELGVKEADFTKMLVDRKYLYRRATKQNRLFPYATPKCQGVFAVKEIEFGNGLVFQSQTLVTPIGRAKLTAECVMAGLIKTMPEEHDVLEVW
jgi:phage antirepressor YoqD-like protein